VDAIFDAVTSFQGNESRLDDMTAVAVRITA
jgi:serine phosphatase RsbU (regulator of sigma subunit)